MQNFINKFNLKTIRKTFAFFFIYLLFCSVYPAHAVENISITRNFPNFAVANKIILRPQTQSELASCQNGTIFVNDIGELKSCGPLGGTIPPVWERTGDNVYTADDTDRDLKQVIIGDNAPLSSVPSLSVLKPNVDLDKNEIVLIPSNSTGNSRIAVRTWGANTALANNTSSLNFHVGDSSSDDAKIAFYNPHPLNNQIGLDLKASNGYSNIFMNSAGQVGIGTYTPSQIVDIIGTTEARKLILNSGGTPAELTVKYDGTGNGYYAVYAP